MALCSMALGLALAEPAAAAATAGCPGFAEDLAAMTRADQALRNRWDWKELAEAPPGAVPHVIEQTQIVDRENARRLRQWVRRCGWPTAGGASERHLHDTWLLVQHADHDRALQRAFLAHMQGQLQAGPKLASEVAYLTDRLDIAEGKPQRHGTQMELKEPCRFEFLPLDDRAQVEARRKALGWPTLDAYQQVMHREMLPPSCRK